MTTGEPPDRAELRQCGLAYPGMTEPSLRSWLVGHALPLWFERGIDHAGWGFHETLDVDACPRREVRRCRVQARQVFAFVEGARLGWTGDWRKAVDAGIEALSRRYRRPDGLYRSLVTASGGVADDGATLYDQSFVLLALSAAASCRPGSESEALSLLSAIEGRARHDGGGFAEFESVACLANPLMHLFEAGLAWIPRGQSLRWRVLAGEIAAFTLDRLLDWRRGVIHEFYDRDWRAAAIRDGCRIEPGHLFEWAWLLQRWAMLAGDDRAGEAARLLHESGRRGTNASGDVVLDEIDADFRPAGGRARLWPQTERLKSAALLAAAAPDGAGAGAYRAEVVNAWRTLSRYLDTPVPGLWRDKLLPDGGFADEPSPASTLYHIVSAARQLDDLAAVGR